MRNPFRYFNSSPEVIRLAAMMYMRNPLSLRQVEDLLFERGINICHEAAGSQGSAEVYETGDEALRPAGDHRNGPTSVLRHRDEGDWRRLISPVLRPNLAQTQSCTPCELISNLGV